jgi:hypothetical protein
VKRQLDIIGRDALIDFTGYASSVPAKVDTGADSSSVWASEVSVDKDGVLSFALFAKGSDLYTGQQIKRRNFRVAQVKSSSGHVQIRYQVRLSVVIGGRRIRAYFNLSDRSRNQYPVLIGRRTLAGKFLVDVRRRALEDLEPPKETQLLNEELREDPHVFFNKYHKDGMQQS